MKKIYILIGITTLSLTGCNSLLDELPDNQVRIDTPEKVRRVVTNAYPTASTAVISELSSDNIADIGTIITYANYLSEEASYWQRIQEYSDSDTTKLSITLIQLWKLLKKWVTQNLPMLAKEKL